MSLEPKNTLDILAQLRNITIEDMFRGEDGDAKLAIVRAHDHHFHPINSLSIVLETVQSFNDPLELGIVRDFITTARQEY